MSLPFLIISGFQDAGKTTFIKHLLQYHYKNQRVVIIENEFGKTKYDNILSWNSAATVRSIRSSCICCTSSRQLLDTLQLIIADYSPDVILLEPSSLARIRDIKLLLQEPSIAPLLHLDKIITLVDGSTFHRRMLLSHQFFIDQLQESNLIAINKLDQLTEQELCELTQSITELSPNSTIFPCNWDTLFEEQLDKLLLSSCNKTTPRKIVPRRMISPSNSNFFPTYSFPKENLQLQIGQNKKPRHGW